MIDFKNKRISLKIFKYILLLFLLVLVAFLLWVSSWRFKNFSYTDGVVVKTGVGFPCYFDGQEQKEYILSFKIDYSIPLQRYVRVIPDDRIVSIKINGEYADLSSIRSEKLSDYENGFVFDLGKYLKVGQNDIEICIFNAGGRTGVNIISALLDPAYFALLFSILIIILLIVFCILSDFRISNKYIIVLICSLFLSLIYLTVTPYNVRSHDAEAHIEYIEYIVKNKSLPLPEQGWAFYHPPLYYITGAIVYSLFSLIGVGKNSIYYGLQLFSLALYFIYLLVNLNTLRSLFLYIPSKIYSFKRFFSRAFHREIKMPFIKENKMKKYFLLISFILLALWPSGIIHSVRVGNDSLFYLLFALSFNSIIKWEIENNDKYITTFSLWATLSLIAKTNGLILFVIFGILFLLRFLKDRNRKKWIKYLKKLTVVIICFSIGFFIAFHNPIFNLIKGRKIHFLVGNLSTLASNLKVGNEAKNYLWFDTKIFITEPFTSPWDDGLGRQYFWNYFFKTSLFGEFSYSNPFHKNLAVVISFVFLLMTIFMVAGILIINLKGYEKILCVLVSFVLIILSSVLFRMSVPASCSNDFRYVLPVLVPFCFIYSYILNVFELRGFRKLVIFGIVIALSLVIFSSVFIVALALIS